MVINLDHQEVIDSCIMFVANETIGVALDNVEILRVAVNERKGIFAEAEFFDEFMSLDEDDIANGIVLLLLDFYNLDIDPELLDIRLYEVEGVGINAEVQVGRWEE